MVKDVERTVVMPSPALVVPADWTLPQHTGHRDKQQQSSDRGSLTNVPILGTANNVVWSQELHALLQGPEVYLEEELQSKNMAKEDIQSRSKWSLLVTVSVLALQVGSKKSLFLEGQTSQFHPWDAAWGWPRSSVCEAVLCLESRVAAGFGQCLEMFGHQFWRVGTGNWTGTLGCHMGF